MVSSTPVVVVVVVGAAFSVIVVVSVSRIIQIHQHELGRSGENEGNTYR